MPKFCDRSVANMPAAYFYNAMQCFGERVKTVQSAQPRLEPLRDEQQRLFGEFEHKYKASQKSLLTDAIRKKDEARDAIAYVIEHQARLWAEKLPDEEYSIRGRRVYQVFKDFQFRPSEALVAENAKIVNMEQRFAEPELAGDLAAMGLLELNQQMASLTEEIAQLMAQRNEERSAITPGEIKKSRDALEEHYRQFITFLNAVLELHPEESLEQAAQFYNADFAKIEAQIQQSRKKGPNNKKDEGEEG